MQLPCQCLRVARTRRGCPYRKFKTADGRCFRTARRSLDRMIARVAGELTSIGNADLHGRRRRRLTRDKTRKPGKPPLPAATVQQVVDLALSAAQGEASHWTGRMLAKAAGVSLRSVQRRGEFEDFPSSSAPRRRGSAGPGVRLLSRHFAIASRCGRCDAPSKVTL